MIVYFILLRTKLNLGRTELSPRKWGEDLKTRRFVHLCIAVYTSPFLTRLARIDRARCELSIRAILIKNGDGVAGQTAMFWSRLCLRALFATNWILWSAIRKWSLFRTSIGPDQKTFFWLVYTSPFFTRVAPIESGHCALSIRASLVKNGVVEINDFLRGTFYPLWRQMEENQL